MSDIKKLINIFFFLILFSLTLIPLGREIKGQEQIKEVENPILIENNTIIGNFGLDYNTIKKPLKTYYMLLTGYSSTEDQTDSTPFITASMKHVEDGIVANNLLPFGTKVRIPELYGNKEFVVEDRMHFRKSGYNLDIWFPTREDALNFGVKKAHIEIIE
ncbi:MAG: 3D domain-containing protein [Candidatus Paceibacterota bacterium]